MRFLARFLGYLLLRRPVPRAEESLLGWYSWEPRVGDLVRVGRYADAVRLVGFEGGEWRYRFTPWGTTYGVKREAMELVSRGKP